MGSADPVTAVSRASVGADRTSSTLRSGVELVLTSACNLDCSYCYQDRHPRRRMSWSTVERALDSALEGQSNGIRIGFYGGEPLLAFDLLARTVEETERRCPKGRQLSFCLSTNGLLLDAAKAAFLAAHEVETQISFDGSPSAQELRAPGTHRGISRRLRGLKKELPDYFARLVKVAVTVTPKAVPGLAGAVADLMRMGVRNIDLAPATGGDEWSPRVEAELKRQFKRIHRAARRHYRRKERVPITLFRRPPGRVAPAESGEMCGVASCDSLTVDVDGGVYGCTALARSYQSMVGGGLKRWVKPLRIGALAAPDLEERIAAFRSTVAASPLFGERNQKRSGHGPCRECRFRGECLICPAAIARAGEDPHRVPDFLCAFSRISLSYRERFPAQLFSSPRPSAS